MLKTLRHRPGAVFALVLLWKAALLVFTAQPIPANDSFFYDGAVVNLLVQGRYCNPAIANALPISGHEIFSAYPPLYQLTLLGWMRVAGPSVLSAMWLHFLLFALYAALVLATLRELRIPVLATHLAGLFLLGLTFHDRPDSLAHVLGMAAIYAVARALRPPSELAAAGSEETPRSRLDTGNDACGREATTRWHWLAAAGVILCLGTSLQIGGVYFLLIWLVILLCWRLPASWLSLGVPSGAGLSRTPRQELEMRIHPARYNLFPGGFPWPALVVMSLVPVALALGVKYLWPQLWAGFQEHAQQTPSLTAWRKPGLTEVIKIIRTVPGLLVALALVTFSVLAVSRRRDRVPARTQLDMRQQAVLLAGCVAAAAVLVGALFFLTANIVLITAYLQPLVVGLFLALWTSAVTLRRKTVVLNLGFGLAVLLASTRAIGLTTIGWICARDVSRGEALTAVARELAVTPNGSPVAVSAAYLYDAWPEARRLQLLHSDWLGPAVKGEPNAEVDALRAVKPARLILTQFDYHRRYARVLGQLQSASSQVGVRVENLARVRPPDASPRWQRVVQHVSWAPVLVTLEWDEPTR